MHRPVEESLIIDAVPRNAPLTGRIGQGVYLGPTFTGSVRWYGERYAHAMAVVRALGQPDTFVTFTANPKRKKICEALLPGQTSPDRLDVVARINYLKDQQLLDSSQEAARIREMHRPHGDY